MPKKPSIFDNATVKRAVQDLGKKSGENLVYSIEIELNKKPLIITLRVGADFSEAMVTDKTTGKMLEYIGQKGKNIEIVKIHNRSPEDIKKMLST